MQNLKTKSTEIVRETAAGPLPVPGGEHGVVIDASVMVRAESRNPVNDHLRSFNRFAAPIVHHAAYGCAGLQRHQIALSELAHVGSRFRDDKRGALRRVNP